MKRRAFIILAAIALGAATNVALAWYLALRPQTSWMTRGRMSDQRMRRLLSIHVARDIRVYPDVGRLFLYGKPRWPGIDITPTIREEEYFALVPPRSCFADAEWLTSDLGHDTEERFAGWPWFALRSLTVDEAYPGHARVSTRGHIAIRSGILPPSWGDGVPSEPIAVGFIANTTLYAGMYLVLFGLLRAPFVVRRRRRERAGCCGRCAYPLGGRQVCPECGAGS